MPAINYYAYPTVYPTVKRMNTTTALAALAEWGSVSFFIPAYSKLAGSVYTDVGGTMYLEQSNNQYDWDISSVYSVPAADGKGFEEKLILPYARVRYVNGGTPQTSFRLTFNFR